MAVVGFAEILLVPKTAGLQNSLRRAGRDIGRDFGQDLAKGITTGLGVALVASAKFALDYEKSFNRIAALTNTSTKQLNEFNESIKRISKDSGVGPKQLADGLYFIQSAGISATEGLKGYAAEADRTRRANEALETSARLVKIGFGDLETSAQALTSLMIAYKKENLSAAAAGNLLAGAVSAGKAEAQDLAKAIGDFIPTASALGVSAQQALALEAALTQTGQSAQEAATQVRTVLTSFIQLQNTSDTDQIDLLDKLGISPKRLAESIKGPDGLQKTLLEVQRLIQTTFSDQTDQDLAFKTLFENVRAFRGVVGALQSDYVGALEAIQNANSGLGAALSAELRIDDTFSVQIQKAFAAVQVFAIEIGTKLLPVVKELVISFAPLGFAFVKVVEGAVSLLQILSPLLPVVGALTTAFVAYKVVKLSLEGPEKIFNALVALNTFAIKLQTAATLQNVQALGAQAVANSASRVSFLSVLGSLNPVTVGVLAVGAALVAGIAIWRNHQKSVAENKKEIKNFSAELLSGKDVLTVYTANLQKLVDTQGAASGLKGLQLVNIDDLNKNADEQLRLIEAIKKAQLTIALNPGGRGGAVNTERLDGLKEQLKLLEQEATKASKGVAKAFEEAAKAGGLQKVVGNNSVEELNQFKNALAGVTTAVGRQGSAFEKTVNVFANVENAQDRIVALNLLAVNANEKNSGSIKSLVAATLQANSVLDKNKQISPEVVRELEKLSIGWQKAGDAALSLKGDVETLNNVSLNDFLSSDQGSALQQLGQLGEQLDNANVAIRSSLDAIAAAEKDVTAALKDQQKVVADIQKERDQEVKREKERAKEIIAAKKSISDAEKAVVAAEKAVNEQRKTISDLRVKAEVDAVRDIKDAKADVVKAEKAVADAIKESGEKFADIAVKQAALDKARAAESAGAADVIAKNLANEEEARNKVLTSQKAFADKQFDLGQAQRDVVVAQRDVRDATDAVTKAQNALVEVSQDLIDKQSKGFDAASLYAAAQLKIEEAVLKVSSAQLDSEQATLAVAAAQRDVQRAQQSVIGLQREQASALDAVRSKSRDLTSAQKDLNKVIRETASDSKSSTDAIKALRDAQLDVRSSVLAVAEAQDKLNKARKNAQTGVDGQTREELRREVERAQIDLEKARNSVGDNTDKVRFSRQNIGDVARENADKRAAAADKIKEAQRGVSEAEQKASEFSLKFLDVQDKIVESQLKVKDAELKRQESLLKVRDAQLSVVESSNAVLEVDEKQKTFLKEINDLLAKRAEAEKSVVKAREGVDDAQNKVGLADKKVSDTQFDLAQAERDVKLSNDNVQLVIDAGVNAVKAKLEELEKNRIDAENALLNANQIYLESIDKISEARDRQAEAVRKVGESEAALITAREAVVKAEDVLKEKIDAVKDAKQNVIYKTQELKDLEFKHAEERKEFGINFAERLAAAEDKVTDSRKKLKDTILLLNEAENKRRKILDEYNLVKAVAITANADKSVLAIKALIEQLRLANNSELYDALAPKFMEALFSTNDQQVIQKYIKLFNEDLKKQGLGEIPLYPYVDDKGNIQLTPKIPSENDPGRKTGPGVKDSPGPGSPGANPTVEPGASGTTTTTTTTTTTVDDTRRGARQISGRQYGGPVLAGETYRVNEVRPEIFRNNSGDYLIPGGNQYRSFPTDGIIVPSVGEASKTSAGYVDNSVHNYNVVSNTTDPELTGKRFYELSRREKELSRRGR